MRPSHRAARNVFAGDVRFFTSGKHHGASREPAKADLWPLQVNENADVPAGLVAGRADRLIGGQVVGVIAVAHV
jgi:hypothetical protein